MTVPTEGAAAAEATVTARPRATHRASLVAWRLVLAAIALASWLIAMGVGSGFTPGDWVYFSQCSTIFVALAQVIALGSELAGRSRVGRVVRGATTSYALVTLLIYATLLGADYSATASKLEHLVVPILALVDWLLTVRRRLAWFVPVCWTAIPLAYLPVYISASRARGPLYDFLDPSASDFGRWIVILIGVFLAVEYVVWLIGLSRRR